MSVEVSAKNLNITKSLVQDAEEKVSKLGKYVGGLERAEVRFVEERNPRISDKDICNLVLVGRKRVIRVRASAPAPAVALDRVVDKAVHRVEKLKVH